MASRKDFASKKRATKPVSKKPAAKPQPIAKQPARVASQNSQSNTSKPARKKLIKLVIASIIVIPLTIFALSQLTKVDPREMRETAISELIEEKLNQSNNESENVVTTVQPEKPKVVKPKKELKEKIAKTPPKSTTKAVSKVPVKEKSSKAEQKEPYQFYKILAENTVPTENIDVYKSTPKTVKLKTRTMLQTGSFKSAKDAERMKVRLILNNFQKVTVKKIASDKGTWYRVRTGPFTDYKKLKSALAKLNKLNITPLQVPVK